MPHLDLDIVTSPHINCTTMKNFESIQNLLHITISTKKKRKTTMHSTFVKYFLILNQAVKVEIWIPDYGNVYQCNRNELKGKLDSKWSLRPYLNGIQNWHKGKLLKGFFFKENKPLAIKSVEVNEFLVRSTSSALFPTYLVSQRRQLRLVT